MYGSVLTVILIGGFAVVSFATSGAAGPTITTGASSEVGSALTGDDGEGRTADAAERALVPGPVVTAAPIPADAAERRLVPPAEESTATTTGTADAAERRLVPSAEPVPAPTGTADSLEHQLVDGFDRLPKPGADR